MITDYAKIVSGIGIVVAHLFDLFGKPDDFSATWMGKGVDVLASYGDVKIFLSLDVKNKVKDMLIVAALDEEYYVGVDYSDGVVVLENHNKKRVKYDIKQRKVIE